MGCAIQKLFAKWTSCPKNPHAIFLKLIERKDSPALERKRLNLLMRSLTPRWPSVINLSGMRKTKAWTWNMKDMTQRPGRKARPRLWTHSSPEPSRLDPSARNHRALGWFSPASGLSAGRCPGAQGSPGKDWKGDGDLGVSFSSVLFLQFIFLNGCVVLLSFKKREALLDFSSLNLFLRENTHTGKCTTQWIFTNETHPGHQHQIKEQNVPSTPETPHPATPPPSDRHLTSNITHSCSQVGDLR